MNTVVAFLLLGGIALATSSTLSRSTSSGWGSPPSPIIDLELTGDLLTSSGGFTGGALAAQNVTESASGDSIVPAEVLSSSGIIAAIGQDGEILEIVSADASTGSTNTYNSVEVSSEALGGDSLNAIIIGANAAEVANEAQTIALGGGLPTTANASSSNLLISKSN